MAFRCERHGPLDLGGDVDSFRRHPVPFGYRIMPRIPGTDAEKLEQLIADSTP